MLIVFKLALVVVGDALDLGPDLGSYVSLLTRNLCFQYPSSSCSTTSKTNRQQYSQKSKRNRPSAFNSPSDHCQCTLHTRANRCSGSGCHFCQRVLEFGLRNLLLLFRSVSIGLSSPLRIQPRRNRPHLPVYYSRRRHCHRNLQFVYVFYCGEEN